MGGGITNWYQSEVVALDLRVKVDNHKGLCVGHESMMVNGFYMHQSYIHAFHSIIVVDTCMIDVI